MDGSTRRPLLRSQRLAVEVLEDRLLLSGDSPLIAASIFPPLFPTHPPADSVSVASPSTVILAGVGEFVSSRPAKALPPSNGVAFRPDATDDHKTGRARATTAPSPESGTPRPEDRPTSQTADSPQRPDEDDEREYAEQVAPARGFTPPPSSESFCYFRTTFEEAFGTHCAREAADSSEIVATGAPADEATALRGPRRAPSDFAQPSPVRAPAAAAPPSDLGEPLDPDGAALPPSPTIHPASEQPERASEPWRLLPEALVPFAGGVPTDLEKLRQNVDAFFAHLAYVGEAAVSQFNTQTLLPWLVAASAVAYEFARSPGRSLVRRLAARGAVAAELQIFTAKDEP